MSGLRERECDLIHRVPARTSAQGSAEGWIYVLLEHQSRLDREMSLRLLL